ncbi:MAG: LAO/AO transport system kinase, partial [Ulvibacter sp.]
NGYFQQKRKEQNKFWLIQTIEQRLKSDFFGNISVANELENQLKLLDSGKTTPFEAAAILLDFRM